MFKKSTFAVAALTIAATAGAHAQEYPTRPVTVVMPYAAGGPGDTLARILAQSMTKTLKQTVIVENVGGAGGTLGSARVAAGSPDGYTLLMNHVNHATSSALYPKLRYDPVKDFEPIGQVADLPSAFVAKKDFPANNFNEFIAYLKANKEKVNHGHSGTGSAGHLCTLLFYSAIDTKVTIIPYKGSGPAMNDMLGGQIDVMCDQIVNVVSHVKAGKIKAYAIASKQRSPALPNLPTTAEAGLPGFELNIWYGMFAPKGTPKPIIDKLTVALQEALNDPAVKQRFADLGASPAAAERSQPDGMRTLLKSEIDRWTPVIKKAGIYGE